MVDPYDFAINLALLAGNLLKTCYNPAGNQAFQKTDQTVVTEADLAADKLITQAILNQYPEDKIISEESSHLLEDAQYPTWIIDPLDGTTNFSLGLSIWGVSIARVVDGNPDLGVLFFPMINELYSSKVGHGAFMNNNPILTRAPNPAQPMSFFACCSRSFRYYDINIPYKPRIMGSCAYSFCMLARGSALISFDAAPKIWDLAAIWLLVQEAGGVIASFEAPSPFPISSNKDFSIVNYPTMGAATLDVYKLGQQNIRSRSKSTIELKPND